MLEDKNTYITETGALMSAHDYSFLSADQKERCKVYKMENTKEDKPDFEALAKQKYIDGYIGRAGGLQAIYVMACEKIWNDYVIPLKSDLKKFTLLDESQRSVATDSTIFNRPPEYYDNESLLRLLQERDAKIFELQQLNDATIQFNNNQDKRWREHSSKLESEITRLKSELDEAKKEIDRIDLKQSHTTQRLAAAKTIINEYHISLQNAESLLKEIKESLYLGEDLDDKEVFDFYIRVVGIVKSEIESYFLKDKR